HQKYNPFRFVELVLVVDKAM
nr:RecName: Full=Zinc metalloproteinase-disintegrin-like uracoina-1; AltName: Full=Snake venom metalloprotease; Short=SVMP [Crotalus vegrandis]